MFLIFKSVSLNRLLSTSCSFGTGWGDKGFIRVQMTGDQNGPCGMYTYAVAPSFSFRRAPPSILPAPPSTPPPSTSPPPSPLPGSSQCPQDPPKCFKAFLFGGRLGASREEFIADICSLSNISRICPCWCAAIEPPSPPSPPRPPLPHPPIPPTPPLPPTISWQSQTCPRDEAKTCNSLVNNVSILQECGKNTSFRSACPCSCQVRNFNFKSSFCPFVRPSESPSGRLFNRSVGQCCWLVGWLVG